MFKESPHFIFAWRSQFYFTHAEHLDVLATVSRQIRIKRTSSSLEFSQKYYDKLAFFDLG